MVPEDKKLYSNFDYETALSVQQGVQQPGQVSNSYIEKIRARKRQEPTVEELVSGILHGDRIACATGYRTLSSLFGKVGEAGHHRCARCRKEHGD